MKPLVTFLIPSYNQPRLLRRAVESIYQQSYRPIEIIVSDDNSPEDVFAGLTKLPKNQDIFLRPLKSNRNLRPYWNFHHARRYVSGKYFLAFPHDDFLTDNTFIQEAVELMEGNKKCHVVIANSIYENANTKIMQFDDSEYRIHEGNAFITGELWKTKHPAYSAVVLDNHFLLEKKYDSWTFGENELKKINLEPDEFFLGIVLCAEDSEVALSGKVVSVRGNPMASYSKSPYWQSNWRDSCFLAQYEIIQYFSEKGKVKESKYFKKLLITKYYVETFNWGILNYLCFEKEGTFLMIKSFFFSFIVEKTPCVLRKFFKKHFF